MLGLIDAVEMFDDIRGLKFSTYVSYRTRQTMRRGVIANGRTMSLPFTRYGFRTEPVMDAVPARSGVSS